MSRSWNSIIGYGLRYPMLKFLNDISYLVNQQELSYHKQIMRQLRIQYVESIYMPKYYTMTLKSRLKVTRNHCKRNHWIDHRRLSSSRVSWRWILSWPWHVVNRSLKIIENGIIWNLGTVSYSPSIVTLAVSLAISEIFSVKEWPDLEIWIWGHWRSLKMAQFNRPCMTFY